MDRKRRRTRIAIAAAIIVPIAACDEQAAAPPGAGPPAAAPRQVEVFEAVPADIPVSFDFTGRTASSQRVEIRARVSGYLDEIAYTEGEFVEEGDLMFRIDQAPFESKLRAAKAELAQQQARLENAEALLARIEPLVEAEAVAQKELDDAVGQVRAAAAAVEAASAGVYDAELNLGYTSIEAPVRGLTSSAEEREGAYISGITSALTYVAKIDPIWVEFSVSETQVLLGRSAEASRSIIPPEDNQFDVVVTLVDGTVHPQPGRISFQDASVSTRTGTFLLRAEIPNPEETLRPGQYVRIALTGAKRPDAIAVPKRAVHEGSRSAYIWVIDSESKAEQRPVDVGPWIGDRWVIERGLREGDRVVVNGVVGLTPGALLTVGRTLSLEEAIERGEEDDGR